VSLNPARLLGLKKKGRLMAGFDADITVLDPLRLKRVPDKFVSRSANSPFTGRPLRGWPAATVVSGKIVFRAR
jgi:dihydroorotase-like cyclic amidohydrolase